MHWLAVLLMLVCVPGQAQTGGDLGRMFVPSPVSVILGIGRWLIQGQDRVYEVTVRGLGRSHSEAQNQALKLAVEQTLGSVIISESQVDRREQQVVYADLINHATGIVDRFELLRQGQDANGLFWVELRVWVRESRISDQMFGAQTATAQIRGPQIAVTMSSERRQRETGDQVAQSVLRGFPTRALEVRIKSHAWQMTGRSQARLNIEASIEWNDSWTSGFYHALRSINGIDSNHPCNADLNHCRRNLMPFVVMRLRPGIHGARQVLAWTEMHKFYAITDNLMQEPLVLQVELRGAGTVLRRECVAARQVRSETVLNDWFGLMSWNGLERRFEWDPIPTALDIWTFVRTPLSLSLQNLDEDLIRQVDRLDIAPRRRSQCHMTT